MTGGLDNTVRVWDVRKFSNSRLRTTTSKCTTAPTAIGQWTCSKSINSSYFSPSGQYAVATTMADKLEIFHDIHLSNDSTTSMKKSSSQCTMFQPITRYNHDNRTGRWLSTFMATYHPTLDIFCIGSMNRPRCIDIFDHTTNKCVSLVQSLSGEQLTAVNSRCCFHPRTDRIIIAGGNSSGRVTVVR
jgi:WD repeat-containing protein 76